MTISLAAEPIFHLGTFPITNTLVVSWVIIIFLAWLALLLRLRLKAVPHGLQNFVEIVLEGAFNFITSVTGDRSKTRRFFPLVFTIFLFVILSNWVEIIPGLGTVGLWEIHHGEKILIPFIRSSSADLNVTIAIAIVSVVATQIFGAGAIGFFKYFNKFIPLRGLFKIKFAFLPLPSFSGLINFFVGFLELIAELAKIVSFSFRLFGNIFAGEVLLLVMLFLVPYLVPLPFLVLEIFIGFVQALIFSMLTLVFLTSATAEPQ